MPKLTWPNGCPFDGICAACRAPIHYRQAEHTCGEDSGLHEAAKAQEQRIAAQQAELARKVDARLG